MLVHDFMIKDVITVKKETTIKDLLALFIQHKISGVPVVDDENRLVGMISDGDVLRFLKPTTQTIYGFFSYMVYVESRSLDENVREGVLTPVERIMTRKNLVFTSQEKTLDEVFALLSKHHFKKLPVVNQEKVVVGVVSRGDVIRQAYKELISE